MLEATILSSPSTQFLIHSFAHCNLDKRGESELHFLNGIHNYRPARLNLN